MVPDIILGCDSVLQHGPVLNHPLHLTIDSLSVCKESNLLFCSSIPPTIALVAPVLVIAVYFVQDEGSLYHVLTGVMVVGDPLYRCNVQPQMVSYGISYTLIDT